MGIAPFYGEIIHDVSNLHLACALLRNADMKLPLLTRRPRDMDPSMFIHNPRSVEMNRCQHDGELSSNM
jgi:hypothetical protein